MTPLPDHALILEDKSLPLEHVSSTVHHWGAHCCGRALDNMARFMCKKRRGCIPVKGKSVLSLNQGA